jgi:hypothetical protein
MKAHAFMFRAPGKLHDIRVLINEIANARSGYIAATRESVSVLEAFWNELVELGIGYRNHGHGNANRLVAFAEVLGGLEKERKSVKEKAVAAYELRANGFTEKDNKLYDLEEVVGKREFAIWAYQTTIDVIAVIFDYWPHPDVVDGYRELYSVPLRDPEKWPNNKI